VVLTELEHFLSRRTLMKVFPKLAFFVVTGLVLAMGVIACGSTTSTGSTPSNPTTAPTTAPTPTPTPAASTFTVQTAQVMVNGKMTMILTDAQGRTLYYFIPDTASKTACTGSCAQAWPPLLFTGTGNPSASTHLPAQLEVYKNANGNQIVYNDHPLYTYSGDTAPGQTKGEGLFGKWFVCTPALAKNQP
jgi:predicted lipoprotein with Yx(FWY)xxD motif